MGKKQNKKDILRSSAAEYLAFVAATGDSEESISMRYEDENIWLTQKMLATLYGVDVRTISEHIVNIFSDRELSKESTIRKFRIVQKEGNREVAREVAHYNLNMIIAVGFKVNNERAVQFRKWANGILKDYTIQGWAMDDERLKNGGSILTRDYFEKQLEKIREIRMSERRLSQKIADIYATSLDYDADAKATRRFFATVANKMHYAVHGRTAALAKKHALTEFEKYRVVQDRLYESDFDRFMKENGMENEAEFVAEGNGEMLEKVEQKVKEKGGK